MLKKILIGLGLVVIVFTAFVLSYFFYFTRLASPEANVHYESPELQIDLNYCRPSKNGRIIFGPENSTALVPYGKYWRLGANQATEIEFNQGVILKNKKVDSGRYRMYAIPGESTWVVRLNSEPGVWGASEPDYSKDIVEIEAATQEASTAELFTILIEESKGGALIKMHWDKTVVEIDVKSAE